MGRACAVAPSRVASRSWPPFPGSVTPGTPWLRCRGLNELPGVTQAKLQAEDGGQGLNMEFRSSVFSDCSVPSPLQVQACSSGASHRLGFHGVSALCRESPAPRHQVELPWAGPPWSWGGCLSHYLSLLVDLSTEIGAPRRRGEIVKARPAEHRQQISGELLQHSPGSRNAASLSWGRPRDLQLDSVILEDQHLYVGQASGTFT